MSESPKRIPRPAGPDPVARARGKARPPPVPAPTEPKGAVPSLPLHARPRSAVARLRSMPGERIASARPMSARSLPGDASASSGSVQTARSFLPSSARSAPDSAAAENICAAATEISKLRAQAFNRSTARNYPRRLHYGRFRALSPATREAVQTHQAPVPGPPRCAPRPWVPGPAPPRDFQLPQNVAEGKLETAVVWATNVQRVAEENSVQTVHALPEPGGDTPEHAKVPRAYPAPLSASPPRVGLASPPASCTKREGLA